MKTIKRKKISKFLSQRFGGKWNFDGFSGWWCDDHKRFVFKKRSQSKNHTYKLYGQNDSVIRIFPQ